MPMLEIAYTPIWFDYPVSDGTYTPKQLQKAGLRLYHSDPQSYRLRWPGGPTQPPRPAPPPARPKRPAINPRRQSNRQPPDAGVPEATTRLSQDTLHE